MPKRYQIISALLLVALVVSIPAPATRAANSGDGWRILAGLLCTGAAIGLAIAAVGKAEAPAQIVSTSGGMAPALQDTVDPTKIILGFLELEGKLMGAGAGKDKADEADEAGDKTPKMQPSYADLPEPSLCGPADSCLARTALVGAEFQALALTGWSRLTDSLLVAINDLDVNGFLADVRNQAPTAVLKADFLSMAAQMDHVVHWYGLAEAELASTYPEWSPQVTPQFVATARDWIIANGLPADEVAIFQNAGLTAAEIDSIEAMTIENLGLINLAVQPLTMSQVLQAEADAYRLIGLVSWTGVDDTGGASSPIRIEQNAPNPFNPATRISFNLPERGRVKLSIYDVRGARMATLLDAELPAGEQAVEWNGKDDRGAPVPSGIYVARLETAVGGRTLKVTLAR